MPHRPDRQCANHAIESEFVKPETAVEKAIRAAYNTGFSHAKGQKKQDAESYIEMVEKAMKAGKGGALEKAGEERTPDPNGVRCEFQKAPPTNTNEGYLPDSPSCCCWCVP